MLREVGVDWLAVGADIARRQLRVVSSCSCGIVYTLAAWRSLPLVGVQLVGDDRLQLRNCGVCGSTLGVWVDQDGDPVPDPTEPPERPHHLSDDGPPPGPLSTFNRGVTP